MGWRKQTDSKIERLESSINNLIDVLSDRDKSHKSLFSNDSKTNQSASRSVDETDLGEIDNFNDRTNGYYNMTRSHMNDRTMEDENSLFLQDILTDQEIDLSLDFFFNTLSKYLPIFIFDYIPRIDRDVKKISPLLIWSILSVASLYMSEFRHKHQSLLSRFKTTAGNLSPAQIFDKQGRPYNLIQTLYDLLGCIIAAAWVGDDVGVRCCLIASDLAGRLSPQILEEMKVSEVEKRAVFAFSLTSYIIERRLQISYTKSDFNNMRNEMSANRDFFLPLYLNKMFLHKDNSQPVSTEYKVNANVELCTLILTFQTELSKNNNNVSSDFILNWSSKLNMWLADWVGRLTTHLDQSSIKPTLLTFHFGKLFLYIQVINNAKAHMENLHVLFSRAETAALDIIEMLLLDNDIRRLIKVGPIFYATIFVTATALLLKIVTIAPRFNYKFNEKYLLLTSERAYGVLDECVTDYQFPCYQSIQALGKGINKVKERSTQKFYTGIQFDPPVISKNTSFLSTGVNEITNQENSLEIPEQIPFDIRFDSGPGSSLDKNGSMQNPSSINPLMDYKEVWESHIFENDDFLWNGFNADLMKSLYESPTEEIE